MPSRWTLKKKRGCGVNSLSFLAQNMPLVQSWMCLPRFRICADQRADFRIEQRLAAADRDHGRAALVDGLQALFERQPLARWWFRTRGCARSRCRSDCRRAAARASSPAGSACSIIGCGLRCRVAGGLRVDDAERIRSRRRPAQVLLPLRARPQLVLGDVGGHAGRLESGNLIGVPLALSGRASGSELCDAALMSGPGPTLRLSVLAAPNRERMPVEMILR